MAIKKYERNYNYRFLRSGPDSYNRTFSLVLGTDTIESLVHKAKTRVSQEHPIVAGADIFGSGYVFLRRNNRKESPLLSHDLDYAVSMALEDARSPLRRAWDNMLGRKLEFVPGRAEVDSSWKKVDQKLKEKGIDGFDIILVRGMSARINEWKFIPTLKNIYKRLTRHNGTLLLEIPDLGHASSQLDLNSFDYMLKQNGISYAIERNQGFYGPGFVLRIDKNPESPQELNF